VDRAILAEHLALAERHVAQGEEHLARQRKLIADLERHGHDTKQARDLLAQSMQALHIGDRDRLKKELEA
jgi:hypothetical protein